MREIKFRAWDILEKRMRSDINLWDIKYGEIFPHTPDQRCFELMQYTGLKDKSGVEIYEGDNVLNDRGQQILVTYGVHEVDAFEVLGWNLCTFYDDFTGKRISEEHEVIGNIHEVD